ncbi:MAG: DUF1080 domain-containing protein [Phycisphaeraceae bacterium]
MVKQQRQRGVVFGVFGAVALAMLTSLATADEPIYSDVKEAEKHPDFLLQGEYAGADWAMQVVALGEGKFRGYLLRGGLPGAGWDGEERVELMGERNGSTVTLRGEGDTRGKIVKDRLSIQGLTRGTIKLERVERASETVGQEPAEGAVVLFDGSSAEHWEGRMDEAGRLMNGATSKQRFGDHFIHLEYLVPFRPQARGQNRGNSGLYMQGRYELQMLDSFGDIGAHNLNGGIYSVAAPKVNMSLPPLTWQTYDIEFRAARFNEAGEKVEHARVTVRHNGVLTHEDVEVPHATTASPMGEGAEPGPVNLQDHGSPVRYRNIWVIER